MTNVPSITEEEIKWQDFVERNNPYVETPPEPDPRYFPYSPETPNPQPLPTPSSSGYDSYVKSWRSDLYDAFDLVSKLLTPESTKRMTPRDALYHPFLVDRNEAEDDDHFPHPYGEGVCRDLHWKEARVARVWW